MGGERIERLEADKRREDQGLIESRVETAAQARTDGNVSWERHRSIGLSIFATPNLTTRARCLAVIGAKRWLYPLVVRIVTDSTADLTPEQQRASGITVVPLNVHFGDQVFRDHVDLSADEFFRRLKASPQLPRTSQPSVGVFEEAYRTLREGGDETVSVHLSSKVSGTYNSALMAAQSVADGAIDVVDSLSTSMALGFMALEGARLARAGKDRKAIAERLQALVSKARVICVVDTLH